MYKNTLLVLFLMIFRTFAQQVWVPFLQESKAPPSVTLQQSNSNAVSFSLQVKGMSVTQKNISNNSYNRLSIPDGEHLTEKGSPELPVISKLIAIPDCDDVILSIIPSGRREFSNYNVSPVPTYQEKQLPDGGTTQTIILKEDNSIYTCDAEFPGKYGEIIETGYVREQKVARIAIFPVQFNPAQRSLTAFTDFQIDISFVNPSSPVNKELGIFRNMMYHTALNYELDGISASSKIDDNVPGNTLGKVATGSVTRVTDLDLLMDADPMPVDYLMITDSSLFNNESLTTLANHRRDYNGYDVAIVQVNASGAYNDIYDDYGTPHDEAIRDFIMDVYDDGTANHTGDGQLGYVLFVGDAWQDDHSTEMVPAATPSYYDSTYEYGGDYYYACTGGDSDSLLDLMYGRLSVGNATELANVVDKIKEYELNSSSIWNDEMTFVGGSYDLFYYSDPDIETMTELLPPPNTKKHYAYMAETGDATSVTEANPIYGQLFTTAQYDDANENCGATNLDDWLYDNSDAGINNDIHTVVYEGHGRRSGLRGNEGLGRLYQRRSTGFW